MAYGRGGAGNIAQAQEVQERKASTTDVEAQKPNADDASAPTPSTSSQTQQYAYKGRGGAGNWYSPSDLSVQGTFVSSTTASSSATSPASATGNTAAQSGAGEWELPTARVGRGGAGNFVWGNSGAAERKKAEEEEQEQRRDALSSRVAEDVERGLARPGDVHLAVGGDRKLEDPAQVNYPVEAGLGL